MPPDKQRNGAAAKPLTPVLSSNFRSTAKSTLTPKLAPPRSASPASPPRRLARSETGPPLSAAKSELRSPPTPTLSGNITPRSGARLSRVTGASPSTPTTAKTGTSVSAGPVSATELSASDKSTTGNTGFCFATSNKDVSCLDSNSGNATPTALPARSEVCLVGSPPSSVSEHSSNSQPSYQRPRPTALPTKEPSFVYADDAIRVPKIPEAPFNKSCPPLATPQGGTYVHPGGNATNISQATKPAHIKLGSPILSPPLQPPSITSQTLLENPLEAIASFKPASLQSASATIPPKTASKRRSTTNTPSTQIDRYIAHPRHSSVGSKTSHEAQSVESAPKGVDSAPPTPKRQGNTSHDNSVDKLKTSANVALPVADTGHIRHYSADGSLRQIRTSGLADSTSSPVHSLASPSKDLSNQRPCFPKADDAASSARRERKVLDLEISNSSLLAINRTLERQMRKQATEIRRFRRLSEAGRLSTVSNHLRSISGLRILSEADNAGAHSSLPFSDEDFGGLEMVGEDDDITPSSSEDETSSLLSPDSITGSGSRHATGEQRRLTLDLSKHQQRLLENQKMEMSIKRCLNWTEELIKDGEKALAYHVEVNEVKLGGKVLTNDKDEQDDFPSIEQETKRQVDQEALTYHESGSAQIRGKEGVEGNSPFYFLF